MNYKCVAIVTYILQDDIMFTYGITLMMADKFMSLLKDCGQL